MMNILCDWAIALVCVTVVGLIGAGYGDWLLDLVGPITEALRPIAVW